MPSFSGRFFCSLFLSFVVDDADLSIWETQYGSTFSGLAAAAPDPSTCLVLLLAMMALHFRRDVVVS